MSKLHQLSSAKVKQARAKKLENAGLNCYLTEGPSKRFLEELERYTSFLYSRLRVAIDYDEWMDLARDASLDSLAGYYDPTKGSIPPFLFSRLRNVATNASRVGKRYISDAEELDELMTGLEKSDYVTADLHLIALAQRAETMGLYIDIDAVTKDVREEVWSPMAKAYAWLRLKGDI